MLSDAGVLSRACYNNDLTYSNEPYLLTREVSNCVYINTMYWLTLYIPALFTPSHLSSRFHPAVCLCGLLKKGSEHHFLSKARFSMCEVWVAQTSGFYFDCYYTGT